MSIWWRPRTLAGFLHTAANFAAINCPPYKYNFQNQMPKYTEPLLFVSLFKKHFGIFSLPEW